MAGIRQLASGIGLVVLFGIGLFFFMIQMIALNNPEPLVSNIPAVNSTLQSLQDRADQLEDLSESSKQLLAEDTPSAVFVFLIIQSAFYIPIGFISFLIQGVGTLITLIFTSLFGAGSNPFYIILAVVNSILVLIIVLAIVRAVRSGETER